MCNYDLDDLDQRWLSAVNGERALMGKRTKFSKIFRVVVGPAVTKFATRFSTHPCALPCFSSGVTTISELEMERTIEELEKQSWEKVSLSLKHNEEEEQDDSVICDVCRSVSAF